MQKCFLLETKVEKRSVLRYNTKKYVHFSKRKGEKPKMKKIAIMGARGFVGKSLTEHLQEGYSVYPITRNEFSLLDENAVKEFIEKEKIDVVIHCANQGGSRKTGYDVQAPDVIGNNLKMFFNVERCLTPEQKLINFGSGAQYNKQRDLIKVSEDTIGEVLPKDDYGYSKYVMSKYIQAAGKENIYNPIIFGLFGKYEDYTFKFISNAIIKNLLKMPIVINQNVVFDYLYLGDFLRILDLAIETDFKNKEFNITPTESIDLVSIVNIINECGNFKSEVTVKNPGLNYQYTGDNKRLLENVGKDFAFTPYKQAIEELYQYYEEHLSELDTEAIRKDELIKYCKTK